MRRGRLDRWLEWLVFALAMWRGRRSIYVAWKLARKAAEEPKPSTGAKWTDWSTYDTERPS